MKGFVMRSDSGKIMDVMYTLEPKIRRLAIDRIRCFCFIDSILDYAYVYVPTMRATQIKWRRRKQYDKSHYTTG
jgi:hypothetical protein